MANTAMLGTLLLPEMRRRGYSKEMSIGPIIGAGGLAMMIPPSALAVLLGSLGHISIGRLLVAIVPAGVLMGALYILYTIGRCWLQPAMAPSYEFQAVALRVKLVTVVRDVLPLGLIIFLVIGLMTLGLATPTESAALGAVGTFGLAMYYRRFSWAVLWTSLKGTLSVTVMTFMILSGSAGYSQLLAFTGVTSGVVGGVMEMALAPIVVLLGMQAVLLVLGMFIDQVSMMLITLPLFMPIVSAIGWDPVWFGVIMLINLEIGLTSPPFGMLNFVMKGVAPPDVTIQDIWKAGFPYIVCDLVAMAVIIAFPAFVLWLPQMMIR
jgi:tripartite ATP-independent transporter DctM subunit